MKFKDLNDNHDWLHDKSHWLIREENSIFPIQNKLSTVTDYLEIDGVDHLEGLILGSDIKYKIFQNLNIPQPFRRKNRKH